MSILFFRWKLQAKASLEMHYPGGMRSAQRRNPGCTPHTSRFSTKSQENSIGKPVLEPEDIESVLSTDRFARYLEWAKNDHATALELYALNCSLSEAFYTPLHMVEVALRNRIDAVLTKRFGQLWWDNPNALLKHALRNQKIVEAKKQLQRDNKAITHGSVIALLSLGFWVWMLGKGRPNDELWKQCLHAIARRPDGKGFSRADFSKPLQKLRKLRNRIAHHEPILHVDLPLHHNHSLDLCTWMAPPAATWIRQHSRFERLWSTIDIALPKPAK